MQSAHRGEKEDRRAVALGAQLLDQAQAIQSRQHAVHDQGGMLRGAGGAQPLQPVMADGHVMPLALERVHDMGGGFLVVFDQQYFHGDTANQCLGRVILRAMTRGCKVTEDSMRGA